MPSALFRILLISLLFLSSPCPSGAQSPASETSKEQQALAYFKQQAAKLHPRHGKIALEGNLATLNLPQDFGYLTPDETEILIHNIWQNPPGSKTMGAIIPTTVDIWSQQAWGIIITYKDDGHVSDKDAATINYDELLQEMKKGNIEANERRREAGYGAFSLVGWATKPHYDQETHKLYWAMDLLPDNESEHGLNYNIRILGREGYLVMSIVGSMAQLPMIEKNKDRILSFVDFNTSQRYADFNPSTDKVAAYGMAALIGGYALAKVGLFKGLIVALVALKKFVILGLLAVSAFFKKLFNRKKKD